MQAIILAAGKGERLRPLTDTMPKCMVPIKKKPLIVHTLDRLSETGKIDEVLIVCGYRAEVIQGHIGNSYCGMKIDYIVNDRYESTNNVYSLYMVGDRIRADCILLECDLFYQQDVIATVLEGDADCNILVSPYNPQTMNGTIVTVKEGDVKELLIKAHQNPGKDYSKAFKTVNIYRFSEGFFNGKLMPNLEVYVKTGNLQSYYELVIGALIYYGNDRIKANIIDESRWYEIDDMQDYEKVEKAEF